MSYVVGRHSFDLANSGMAAWNFDTEAFPPTLRSQAWVDAMQRLRLPSVKALSADPFNGRVTVVESPQGMQFALVDADPQEIAGRSDDQIEGLWLMVLLQGRGTLTAGSLSVEVDPDVIVCGVTRNSLVLALAERHRQLFVRLPRLAILPRLLGEFPGPLVLLDAKQGRNAIFRDLLAGVADNLTTLTEEDLGPIDLGLVEFLVAGLAAAGGIRARGGADGARAAHLHRILQRMEAMLGDPDLSVRSLAEEAGISPRYLRRLFAAEDINFATMLKIRRLERCHAELTSPLHAQLSISEIAFRWGFNDAAHFSRSFRERFGITARELRRSVK